MVDFDRLQPAVLRRRRRGRGPGGHERRQALNQLPPRQPTAFEALHEVRNDGVHSGGFYFSTFPLFHFFHLNPADLQWGLYIREAGMKRILVMAFSVLAVSTSVLA